MADNVLRFRKTPAISQLDLFGHYSRSVSKYAVLNVENTNQEELLRLIDALSCKIIIDTRSLCYFLRPRYDVNILSEEFRRREVLYFRAGNRRDRVAGYDEFFSTLRNALAHQRVENVLLLFDEGSSGGWVYKSLIQTFSEDGRFVPYFGG